MNGLHYVFDSRLASRKPNCWQGHRPHPNPTPSRCCGERPFSELLMTAPRLGLLWQRDPIAALVFPWPLHASLSLLHASNKDTCHWI